MNTKNYNRRVWLNKEGNPSCGNVVAFDGYTTWKGEKVRNTFLAVSDCSVSARLHKTEDDSIEDFTDKIKLLRDELDLFVKHLEESK